MVFGRQISVEEALARVDAVTLDDLAGLAQEYFANSNVAFAAVGDLKELRIDQQRVLID